MEQLVIFIILLGLGFFVGTWTEKRHYRSIEDREKKYLYMPLTSGKSVPVDEKSVLKAELVYGSAVISLDYFKLILASLRKIFGGRVKSYESLIDRARREALLRMKENALGANMIINVRLETATIGNTQGSKRAIGCVEVTAYGTAITIKKV